MEALIEAAGGGGVWEWLPLLRSVAHAAVIVLLAWGVQRLMRRILRA